MDQIGIYGCIFHMHIVLLDNLVKCFEDTFCQYTDFHIASYLWQCHDVLYRHYSVSQKKNEKIEPCSLSTWPSVVVANYQKLFFQNLRTIILKLLIDESCKLKIISCLYRMFVISASHILTFVQKINMQQICTKHIRTVKETLDF